MSQADEIRHRRNEMKRQYGAAFQMLSDILFTEDPVGINFEVNTDEYEPEVGTILPRLRDCKSVDDVRRVVREEFVKWFDINAGPPEKYQNIAERIWDKVVPLLSINRE